MKRTGRPRYGANRPPGSCKSCSRLTRPRWRGGGKGRRCRPLAFSSLATLHAKRTAAESISCPSAGDCTVVGRTATATSSGSFLAVESNGTWLPPTAMPAQSSGYQLSSVSCVKVPVRDTCYSTGSSTATAFTEESENSTAFAPGPVLGAAKLGNTGITENPAPVISCSVSAYCAVGGEYRGTTAGRQPFLDVKTAFGWQYAIGLHGLTARQLKPGGYLFQATYTGSVDYIPAPSATIAVEIAK